MKILCLNLKAKDEQHSQEERLNVVADFCNNNLIDVLLLQEGTYGFVGGNSIKRLESKLQRSHYFYQEPCFGYWSMYQYQCGIITSYAFHNTDSCACKIKSTCLVDSLYLPGAKRVISVNSYVPNIGNVCFVTCHLDSNPATEYLRTVQLSCLNIFLYKKKLTSDVVILGGDFNNDYNTMSENLSYGYSNIITDGPDGIWISADSKLNTIGRLVFQDHYVSDHCGLVAEIG